MTQKMLSDFLQDWEMQARLGSVKRSQGRNILSGHASLRVKSMLQTSRLNIRQKMARTVHKTPEVMVKISGGGKNMPHIQAHMHYISRQGQLKLEDENGELHQGKEGLQDIQDGWCYGKNAVPKTGEKRKEAFNIILSMSPGTDAQSVKNAARAFAQAQFKYHQYVFAAHNDEEHPHVHLCVKAISGRGVRLNPRKHDLQYWREQFAQKLGDHGIAANATLRRVRGIVKKADKQVILHIDQEFQQGRRLTPSYILQRQKHAVIKSIKKDEQQINPAQHKIYARRQVLQQAYGQVARCLAKGGSEDQKLALTIVDFVKTMPPLLTRHETLVQDLSCKGSITNKATTYDSTNKTLNQEISNLEKIH